MDLGFRRLEPSFADATPVPLDYLQLVASLMAMQAASPTAMAEARLATGALAGAHPMAALIALIDGGPGWVEAAMMLDGAFHAALAARNRGFPP